MFFIKRVLIKKKRASIRNLMRGYRFLKETGQMDLLIRIKDDLTHTTLNQSKGSTSRLFFGAGFKYSDIILKQFLILRFANLAFNSAILCAIGNGRKKLYIPIPYEWRLVLEKYGFETDTFWNKIIWFWKVTYFYNYGIFVGFRSLLLVFGKKQDSASFDKTTSVYFNGLISSNLPQNNRIGYDIISWYTRWNNRSKDIEAYCHSVKNISRTHINEIPVIYVSSALATLHRLSQISKFLLGLIWMSFLSFINLLRGKYWNALLLGESLQSFYFRLLNPKDIFADYLFHNSAYLFRPIWTYDAEERGSRVLFYFYSTNIERFKELEGYGIQPYSWQLISWPNYLVWDEYQADFINRAVGYDKNIEIVGPIFFQDSSVELVELPKNSVVVFDIQPHRESLSQTYDGAVEYFTSNVVNKFLEDIHFSCKKNGLIMILKRKRNSNLIDKRYRTLLENFSQSENFISIDPDVSAFRLIKETDVIISMPFTAPSIIAKNYGKSALYYDPIGIIQKDDRGAHGVQILTGLKELDMFIENLTKTTIFETKFKR